MKVLAWIKGNAISLAVAAALIAVAFVVFSAPELYDDVPRSSVVGPMNSLPLLMGVAVVLFIVGLFIRAPEDADNLQPIVKR